MWDGDPSPLSSVPAPCCLVSSLASWSGSQTILALGGGRREPAGQRSGGQRKNGAIFKGDETPSAIHVQLASFFRASSLVHLGPWGLQFPSSANPPICHGSQSKEASVCCCLLLPASSRLAEPALFFFFFSPLSAQKVQGVLFLLCIQIEERMLFISFFPEGERRHSGAVSDCFLKEAFSHKNSERKR